MWNVVPFLIGQRFNIRLKSGFRWSWNQDNQTYIEYLFLNIHSKNNKMTSNFLLVYFLVSYTTKNCKLSMYNQFYSLETRITVNVGIIEHKQSVGTQWVERHLWVVKMVNWISIDRHLTAGINMEACFRGVWL